MKRFNKLETGIWTYIDESGTVFVLTNEEFLKLNKYRLIWLKLKNKYFKL